MASSINSTLKYRVLFSLSIWLAISAAFAYCKPYTLSQEINHQQTLLATLQQELANKKTMRKQFNRIKKHHMRARNIISTLIIFSTQDNLQIKKLSPKKVGGSDETKIQFSFIGSFENIKNFLNTLHKKNIPLAFNDCTFQSNHDPAHSITFTGEFAYEASN
ncbi:MAG: hypothetical protein K0U29_05575 [Gammaproteobacteria bacterium]|nr:hypothetical protein [Gammaproteobacteria bacterium]MCH9744387.1 hypothetical protein [Gammaproteobacteria bacterium]